MKYIKSNHVFCCEDHEINDLINIGDVVSFGTIRWRPKADIHQYYDEYTQSVQIPDGIVLECTSYDTMVTATVGALDVRLDPMIRVELDETFMVIEKKPYQFGTPPTNMHSNDSGSVGGWMYKGESTTKKRFAEFHFFGGYITASEAVFLHEQGDTHMDKMNLVYQMAEVHPSKKYSRHPEIDRMVRDGDLVLPKYV